jgi:hypothetical protein
MSSSSEQDVRVPLEVLATRGDGIFLIRMRDGLGAIVHVECEPPRIWPSQTIASILKFGYWHQFDGDPEPILRAARRAIAS